MANTRHTVVVRKDLNMTAGLLSAQVAHMSDAFMRERIITDISSSSKTLFTDEEIEWMKEPYLSVLAVNCYEDLANIENEAMEKNLPMIPWHDLIPSPTIEGKFIKVFIGISIGPADFDKIKEVTGNLKPY